MASFTIETKKNGLLAAKIQVSGKDYLTGKHKTFVKRVYNDYGLTEAKFKKQVFRYALEFEDEIHRRYSNKFKQTILPFPKLAAEWLQFIFDNLSKSYYLRAEETIKLFTNYLKRNGLSNMPISEITVRDIQLFLNGFSSSTIKSRTVVKLCKELPNNVNFRELNRSMIINRCSSYGLCHKGNHILKEKALQICHLYNLKFEDFFEDVTIEKHYSLETIKGHRRILRAIFNEAFRYDWIKKNPVSATRIGAGNCNVELRIIKESDVFSISEAKTLIQALDKNTKSSFHQTIAIKLMLFTGIRLSELCGLKWSDVEFESKFIHIRRNRIAAKKFGIYEKEPKTSSSIRSIPITEHLANELKRYFIWFKEHSLIPHENLSNCFIIVNQHFNPIYPTSISAWLRKIEKTAGLKNITCHGLRHTYCSLLLSQNVPLETVRKYMGHSDSSTTLKIYSHFIPETNATVIKALSCLNSIKD